jgi:transposase
VRGAKKTQQSMLSLRTPEQRVPVNHPLRTVQKLVDEALENLSGKLDEMYSAIGRPSIPPEQLLKGHCLTSSAPKKGHLSGAISTASTHDQIRTLN